ncbi:MAG: hypothetical protein IJQ53_05620 [Clostridia bacterium]|nr:hypothetical protein [Clostridia bacterium]
MAAVTAIWVYISLPVTPVTAVTFLKMWVQYIKIHLPFFRTQFLPEFFSGGALLAPAHRGLGKVVSPFDGHSVVRERKFSLSPSHKEQCEKRKMFLTFEKITKIFSGKEKARRFFSG